jgi:hypothetical protein
LERFGYAAAKDILSWYRKSAATHFQEALERSRQRWFDDCCYQLCQLLGYNEPQEPGHAPQQVVAEALSSQF